MGERPYTLLSCCMSLDGYVDSASDERLLLSNDADFDRVDAVRADADAILVGAGTVRSDNPALLVRSERRRDDRVAAGRPASPMKVTLTATGDLDPAARFFATGDCAKIVYHTSGVATGVGDRLGAAATLVDSGPRVCLADLLADLHDRGVRRLMVEGGGTVHTHFLTDGLADELQLVVAPFFVGDSRACRFVSDGRFPWGSDNRARLAEARPIGDVVLLRYALSERFEDQFAGVGV